MKNTSKTIRTICEIGIFAALGFVFDELQGILSKGIFVNGGSIGFAMIAVLIVAYRRGFIPAFLTGLLMGLLDIATSAYILNPMQLLLDYILPYAVVGIAGLLKPLFDKYDGKAERILWLIAGAFVGGLAKFLSHYFAGIFFWADPANFAWDLNKMNPYLYCAVYNVAFIGPSIILTGALLVIIYLTNPKILTNKEIKDTSTSNVEPVEVGISSLVTAGGLFLFVYYLVKYIKSFGDYHDGAAYGYDFDPDSMLICVLGAFIVILGVISLVKCFKKQFKFSTLFGTLSLITVASLVYSVARILRNIYKQKLMEKWTSTYIPWYIISVVVLALFISLYKEFKAREIEEK